MNRFNGLFSFLPIPTRHVHFRSFGIEDFDEFKSYASVAACYNEYPALFGKGGWLL